MARILLGALLVTSTLVAGPAQAAGCQKVATGLPGGGACRYTANGPGVYVVSTLSGFRVQYLRAPSTVWVTVAAQVAIPNQPHTGVAVRAGEIPSIAGDLVEVSIGTASVFAQVQQCPTVQVCNPSASLSWMDGFILGQDTSP